MIVEVLFANIAFSYFAVVPSPEKVSFIETSLCFHFAMFNVLLVLIKVRALDLEENREMQSILTNRSFFLLMFLLICLFVYHSTYSAIFNAVGTLAVVVLVLISLRYYEKGMEGLENE
ncbi:MAG: hypothetical protein AAGM67_04865 [Bacteroidota bacterium]